MGYQALLFCPDEKTARTVTQVLSELDFNVVPCNEPFGAVKKLMAEHFDAVVVDCDNEQNATLLFKSARNTSGNQSSLAVAVVEGQAGVAKAFRIGANLVLTKPINVEQAKGTLRVARGLLRKGEASKAAATPAAEGKSSAAPQTAPKLAHAGITATAPVPVPAAPVVSAPAGFAGEQSHPPLNNVAPDTGEGSRSAAPVELTASVPATTPGTNSKSAPEKNASATPLEAKREPDFRTGYAGTGGSASAPAPAREKISAPNSEKPASDKRSDDKPANDKPSNDKSIDNKPSIEKSSAVAEKRDIEKEISGNVSAQPAEDSAVPSTAAATASPEVSGGAKKGLLAVAALILIAAGGYEGWTQWQRFQSRPSPPTAQVAKNPDTTGTATTAINSPAPKLGSATPASAAKPSSISETIVDSSAEAHAKSIAADSQKTATAVPSGKASSTKASAHPIVIKSGSAEGKYSSSAPVVNMSVAAGSASGNALPSLIGSGNEPTPVLQTLSVSQGVSKGLLVKEVQPVYPPSALRMHIEGGVQLMATVSPKGTISAVKILSGDAQLARAAADAVKQWKYKPYLLNGSPVEIQTQVTVNFKLPR